MELDNLKKALGEAVKKAKFYTESTGIAFGGNLRPTVRHDDLSSREFRQDYFERWDKRAKFFASVNVPEPTMTNLTCSLKESLREFILPGTDEIGHVFPVDGRFPRRTHIHENGLVDKEFQTPISEFAPLLVRVAAVNGVNETVLLLDSWMKGESIKIQLCTVLNGLPLDSPLALDSDILIEPLPLKISELPRLPLLKDTRPFDYLGMSLLKVQITSSPVLFRPDPKKESIVATKYKRDNINIETIFTALSLLSNKHVSPSFFWHEYPDASAFNLGIQNIWTSGENRLKPISWKQVKHNFEKQELELTPMDDTPPPKLDVKRLGQIFRSSYCP